MSKTLCYFCGVGMGLLIFLLSTKCRAEEQPSYHLLDVDRISMDYSKIKNNRDAYYDYPDPATNAYEVWDYSVGLNFDFNLYQYGPLKLLYDNRVACDATNKQVRTVGWKYRIGARFWDKVTITEDHYSRHVLDTERDTKFPLENRYTLEILFYGKP